MGPQILHFLVTALIRPDGPNSCSDSTCNARLCDGTLHSHAQTQCCSVCNMHALPKAETLLHRESVHRYVKAGVHIFLKNLRATSKF